MRKLFGILTSLVFCLLVSANANAGSIGLSGTYMSVDGTGSETVATVNENTGGSSSETVELPSIFIETDNNNGWVFGVDWIPLEGEFVNQSKTQTNVTNQNSGTESKTQTVVGALQNHLTFYVEKDVYDGFYIKTGLTSVKIVSNEDIGTGSTYGNETVYGYMAGLGYRYDYSDQVFIKAEVAYNDWETIELDSTNTSNSVKGDIDATSGRISIGYKF